MIIKILAANHHYAMFKLGINDLFDGFRALFLGKVNAGNFSADIGCELGDGKCHD